MALFAGLAAAAATAAVAVDVTGGRPEQQRIAAGRAVAAGAGGQGQAGACFRCHGFDGAAQAAAAVPMLAGQSAEYMHDQLRHYASGERQNAIMSPIASALTEQQRADAAAYYAAQRVPPPHVERPGGDPALIQRGGVLSAVGAAENGVQACQNCHGPAGIGMAPNYPRLAGQPADYIALQLTLWKRGERPGHAPYNWMVNIARRLSDEDIRAVALYFASVQTEEASRRVGVLP
ncbi:c-type cytochrome [Roseomonas sp. SSH11]|uniref:C-type cytochrome n=1 Tax=Pararoseomonas baculiformis TaxID=2820812 RepID=A0ABS4AKJ2_9PROT|nr:c-type cytochrome [Pararoseomonas baculiformis]